MDQGMDAAVLNAIARVTGGNFRLIQRLFAQIDRVLTINSLATVTTDVVDCCEVTVRPRGWVAAAITPFSEAMLGHHGTIEAFGRVSGPGAGQKPQRSVSPARSATTADLRTSVTR